jgi:hypothetical protein
VKVMRVRARVKLLGALSTVVVARLIRLPLVNLLFIQRCLRLLALNLTVTLMMMLLALLLVVALIIQ